MDKHNHKVELLKLYTAVGMVVFGCILIGAGFWVAPLGEIHNSVLVAFGESLTFAGCLFGISHMYSTKHKELEEKINSKITTLTEKNNNN